MGLAWLVVGEVRLRPVEITLACRARSSVRNYVFHSLGLRTVNGESFLLEFVDGRRIDAVLDLMAQHGVPVQRGIWTYRPTGAIVLTPPGAVGG